MKERVKQLCKERRTTLKQIAERMGVAQETLTRIIGGKANTTLSTIQSLADALEVDLWELFTDTAVRSSKDEIHGVIWIGGKPVIINSMKDLQELVKLYSLGQS